MLRDFKSYGSRALNRSWTKPESDTWWTELGSKRELKDEAVIEYIRQPEIRLLIGINPMDEEWIKQRAAT